MQFVFCHTYELKDGAFWDQYESEGDKLLCHIMSGDETVHVVASSLKAKISMEDYGYCFLEAER